MQAIRQTYEDAPVAIPVPAPFQHKRLEVILLLQDDPEAQPKPTTATPTTSAGYEEAFFLLAGLSDDFMAEGREQPPLQERDSF